MSTLWFYCAFPNSEQYWQAFIALVWYPYLIFDKMSLHFFIHFEIGYIFFLPPLPHLSLPPSLLLRFLFKIKFLTPVWDRYGFSGLYLVLSSKQGLSQRKCFRFGKTQIGSFSIILKWSFFYWLYVFVYYPSLCSVTVIKHWATASWGRKGFIWLTVTSPRKAKVGTPFRNLEARTSTDSMEGGGILLPGFSLWLVQLTFLDNRGPTAPGWHWSKWAGLSHINQQSGKCHTGVPTSQLMGVIPQLRLLNPRWH